MDPLPPLVGHGLNTYGLANNPFLRVGVVYDSEVKVYSGSSAVLAAWRDHLERNCPLGPPQFATSTRRPAPVVEPEPLIIANRPRAPKSSQQAIPFTSSLMPRLILFQISCLICVFRGSLYGYRPSKLNADDVERIRGWFLTN